MKVWLVLRIYFFFFGRRTCVKVNWLQCTHCTLKSTYLEFKDNKEYLLDKSNIACVCKEQSEQWTIYSGLIRVSEFKSEHAQI